MDSSQGTRHIRGPELKVGDAILFLGREHRVAQIEPYYHPTVATPARIARDSQGWGITVFDSDYVEVAQ